MLESSCEELAGEESNSISTASLAVSEQSDLLRFACFRCRGLTEEPQLAAEENNYAVWWLRNIQRIKCEK